MKKAFSFTILLPLLVLSNSALASMPTWPDWLVDSNFIGLTKSIEVSGQSINALYFVRPDSLGGRRATVKLMTIDESGHAIEAGLRAEYSESAGVKIALSEKRVLQIGSDRVVRDEAKVVGKVLVLDTLKTDTISLTEPTQKWKVNNSKYKVFSSPIEYAPGLSANAMTILPRTTYSYSRVVFGNVDERGIFRANPGGEDFTDKKLSLNEHYDVNENLYVEVKAQGRKERLFRMFNNGMLYEDMGIWDLKEIGKVIPAKYTTDTVYVVNRSDSKNVGQLAKINGAQHSARSCSALFSVR